MKQWIESSYVLRCMGGWGQKSMTCAEEGRQHGLRSGLGGSWRFGDLAKA